MRTLITTLLLMTLSNAVFAVDIPGTLTVNNAPQDSKAIPGFVTFVSDSTIWNVEATHVISVHRTRDTQEQTILVIDVPLSLHQTHTHVIIPEAIMTYENVLRFVQGLRFKLQKQ